MTHDSSAAGMSTATLLSRGYQRVDQGDAVGAEPWFRAAVAAAPDEADAHGALGDLLAASGRPAEAAVALGCADRLDPEQPHRLAALAEALAATGDRGAAAEACRRWLALRPDSSHAHAALAEQVLALGDGQAAQALLREAVLLDPGNPELAARLARLLTDLGDGLAALELVQPALRQSPDHAPLHFQIGRAWQALRESAKAEAAWRRCLALDEDDCLGAGAALAAAATASAADPAPPTAPYVRALFDRYAERFDTELVGRLGYRAPQLLREAIDRLPGTGEDLAILDLGCGTGLAGVAFASLARHLAGVDLSSRMIDQARRRGLYHQLWTGELLGVLEAEAARWDLILAADVFTYLGDLAPVLAAVAAALGPGGRLAATVERADEDAAVTVTPTRRVRHGAGHVRSAAAAANLNLLVLESAVLRTENRQPVTGLVFVLEKPAVRG